MYTYSFEKLDVWNESKDFTKSIYTITSTFPDQEKFGLVSQLRRASVSICSNIAEGSARSTYKDKAHFTTMAFSSAIEVLNQLILSFEMNFISEEVYSKMRLELESITNKLNGLRNYQTNHITKSTNNQINE
jgi:four helix bundle protein